MRKKTDAEFRAEVQQLTHGEYTPLEPYVNARTKILMRHNTCGYQWYVRPHDFIRRRRCPRCGGKIRMTDAQFKAEVYRLVGDEYSVLGTYQNIDTPIKIKHNVCGYVWCVRPTQFLHGGTRCPRCAIAKRANKTRKTLAQFKQEVYAAVGNDYKVIGKYINTGTKIKMLHVACGHTFEVTPNCFLSKGTRCPACSRLAGAAKRRQTTASFKQRMFKLVGNEYRLIGDYVNAQTKIRLLHTCCGRTYTTLPSNFLRGKRCPYCYGTPKKTTAQFKQEIYNLVGNAYSLIGEYRGVHRYVRLRHNCCGFEYNVLPNNFLRGKRCPRCHTKSHGELFIEHYLLTQHLNYQRQPSFNDLRDTRQLRYDFLVNQHVLIEYQGIQHYHAVDYFGGKQRFAVQQKHDAMKADYAAAHGYLLLAIPYTVDTQEKMNQYLDTHLPCIK